MYLELQCNWSKLEGEKVKNVRPKKEKKDFVGEIWRKIRQKRKKRRFFPPLLPSPAFPLPSQQPTHTPP